MKTEDQVVSLELARALKETGWPQEGSEFYWVDCLHGIPAIRGWHLRWSPNEGGHKEGSFLNALLKSGEAVAAPTANELGESLKPFVLFSDRDGWRLEKRTNNEACRVAIRKTIAAEKEADAHALMWLSINAPGTVVAAFPEREGAPAQRIGTANADSDSERKLNSGGCF